MARLRRFILDLAVRGKLVQQDANDELASDLLKRIAKEKARLVRAGELRKPRDLDSGNDLNEPFAIPVTWRWVRLDSVGAIVGGGTPSAAHTDNFAEPGEGVPWLTPADLGGYSDLYISRGSRDLSEKGSGVSSATMMPKGTVLFTSRAPIGYVAIAANPISTNQGFKSIVPYIADCSRFVATAMKAFAPEIDAKAPGTTFKEVSGKIVAAIPFPLPPLAEQHRIVAKVDELMGLCDRIDAARADREAVRDRLAAASLARLNAPDPKTFLTDACFALDALPALTTRPDQIKALRQTILNLAVRGKLVPQDARDEPAASELRTVEKLKAKLDFKKPKKVAQIEDTEKWCLTPEGWVWARWDQITDWITYGFTRPMEHVDEGIPIVTGKNVNEGQIIFDTASFTPQQAFDALNEKDKPQPGDILITKDGSIGRSAIVEEKHLPFCINQSVAVMWLRSCHFNRRFLKLVLDSPQTQEVLLEKTAGVAIKHISITDLGKMIFPLPPLAEQHRIVAKVDALMALCDRLEANLTATAATRRRLLDALLAEALAPAEVRELEAAQ
ncbi:subunit S of type I restriction-modification system [Mesorhizobium sp. LNHC220B00]|nr:subunit S of type I restriction-modification system [Mesorhizobium sp. LNHC220B00]